MTKPPRGRLTVVLEGDLAKIYAMQNIIRDESAFWRCDVKQSDTKEVGA